MQKGAWTVAYRSRWEFFPRITPAVKYLILVCSGIFLFQFLFRIQWFTFLGLTPILFWRGFIWQPVTYMFLHGGIFHLLFNMFVLWMFGTALESTWGPGRFLKFYFICGIGAGILNAAVTPASPVPTIGSSGAIYGLLMAFAILFPEQLIYIWGIVPVKAKYFVIGIGAIEFLTAVSTTQSGIAHVAHLGGMLFGLVYMKWGDWRRSFSSRRRKKSRRSALRVVRTRQEEKQKLQEQIDRLLDKAARNGPDSLTAEERERFRKLSARMAELEDGK
ncbi:MAG: rhomboid family intramembrane serine protease [Candidatus Sulfobium sp.]